MRVLKRYNSTVLKYDNKQFIIIKHRETITCTNPVYALYYFNKLAIK